MKISHCTLLPLAFLFSLHGGAQAGVVAEHPGYWMGNLTLPDGRVLKSGVELFQRADGTPWGSFSSPDQGAYDIPVRALTEGGETVELDLGFGKMQMAWQGDRFKAVWKQGGASFPVELRQVAGFPKKPRPQDPVAPFPYTDESLAIRSKGGVLLGATLSLPKGVKKPTVVILVPGSGPLTRDEEVAGHRVFAVLADYLLRQGVAVLRYDKRGVSRSTGDYDNHTQADLADDLEAVVGAVKARGQFGRVGLVGHSEGPMVAASVIGRQPAAADFLVSLAGVGLPGLEMLLLQDGLLAKDRGASPQEVKQLLGYISRWYAIVMAEADSTARVGALKALQASLPESDKALISKYKMHGGTLSLEMAAQPALAAMLKADPRADWRRVACPVLALNGSLDLQVPPQSLDGIVASLKAGGNRRVESAVMPSLNHLFQTAQTGSESEYAVIEETIAPAVMQRIAAFVRKQ
ncbi:alpha/beta hydrolase family protein [Massilia brevitalea]|uniref:alpha/beta hydrolase family protein n=1 Tax=Massilia brevitalea TaxID=442526 RepID=UPI002739A63A|nr:alpha/beta hydrolase [Massilia brevitalea]